MTLHAGDEKENTSHDVLKTAAPRKGNVDKSDGSSDVAEGATALNTPRSKGVWGQGRVTLVGDAAHATINNGEVTRNKTFQKERAWPASPVAATNHHHRLTLLSHVLQTSMVAFTAW